MTSKTEDSSNAAAIPTIDVPTPLHLTAAARDLLTQAQRAADEHEAELLAGLR